MSYYCYIPTHCLLYYKPLPPNPASFPYWTITHYTAYYNDAYKVAYSNNLPISYDGSAIEFEGGVWLFSQNYGATSWVDEGNSAVPTSWGGHVVSANWSSADFTYATPTVSQTTAGIYVLEYQGIVAAGTSTESLLTINNHGMSNGDFIVNQTRRSTLNSSPERGSRKITVPTTNTLYMADAIPGQTTGDIIAKYKFVDRSSLLKDGTLSLNLKAEGQSDCSFTFRGD